jgi:DNA repair exonuclease SbcCD ATPase subunit
MTALSDTMNLVNQGQMQTQKNLQSTLNTTQTMTESARMMQLVSSEIAKSLREISQQLEAQTGEQEKRLASAQEASDQLAVQLTSLSDSLARMQQAVDRLTGELDGNQSQAD